jgi:hypothetical protein
MDSESRFRFVSLGGKKDGKREDEKRGITLDDEIDLREC